MMWRTRARIPFHLFVHGRSVCVGERRSVDGRTETGRCVRRDSCSTLVNRSRACLTRSTLRSTRLMPGKPAAAWNWLIQAGRGDVGHAARRHKSARRTRLTCCPEMCREGIALRSGARKRPRQFACAVTLPGDAARTWSAWRGVVSALGEGVHRGRGGAGFHTDRRAIDVNTELNRKDTWGPVWQGAIVMIAVPTAGQGPGLNQTRTRPSAVRRSGRTSRTPATVL